MPVDEGVENSTMCVRVAQSALSLYLSSFLLLIKRTLSSNKLTGSIPDFLAAMLNLNSL
jgi:hypothetical protein